MIGAISLAIAAFFFAIGGLLKGAIGAGAPVLVIPVLAMLYDVKVAVAVMMVPNLVTNIWQGWQFRHSMLPKKFVFTFALAGGLGAGLGTWVLATLSQSVLSLIVAATVLAYVLFRIVRSNWVLSYTAALKLSIPIGIIAGTLQGATGISAPVSLSFYNAMRLERPVFIASVSIYFIAMTVVQIPVLVSLQIMTIRHFWYGVAALLPILGFMPLGQQLAKKFSKDTFDRALLLLLVCLAFKLVYDAVFQ